MVDVEQHYFLQDISRRVWGLLDKERQGCISEEVYITALKQLDRQVTHEVITWETEWRDIVKLMRERTEDRRNVFYEEFNSSVIEIATKIGTESSKLYFLRWLSILNKGISESVRKTKNSKVFSCQPKIEAPICSSWERSQTNPVHIVRSEISSDRNRKFNVRVIPRTEMTAKEIFHACQKHRALLPSRLGLAPHASQFSRTSSTDMHQCPQQQERQKKRRFRTRVRTFIQNERVEKIGAHLRHYPIGSTRPKAIMASEPRRPRHTHAQVQSRKQLNIAFGRSYLKTETELFGRPKTAPAVGKVEADKKLLTVSPLCGRFRKSLPLPISPVRPTSGKLQRKSPRSSTHAACSSFPKLFRQLKLQVKKLVAEKASKGNEDHDEVRQKELSKRQGEPKRQVDGKPLVPLKKEDKTVTKSDTEKWKETRQGEQNSHFGSLLEVNQISIMTYKTTKGL